MPWASPVDPYRDADGYVTVEEAAVVMHCSVQRVRRLVRERLIACRWDGRGDFLVRPETVTA